MAFFWLSGFLAAIQISPVFQKMWLVGYLLPSFALSNLHKEGCCCRPHFLVMLCRTWVLFFNSKHNTNTPYCCNWLGLKLLESYSQITHPTGITAQTANSNPQTAPKLTKWATNMVVTTIVLKPCPAYRPFPRESGEFAPLSNAAATHPDSQLTL